MKILTTQLLVLMFSVSFIVSHGQEVNVEPDSFYKLSFISDSSNTALTWRITITNADGTVSADKGLLNATWQKMSPDAAGKLMTQRFRTPPEAVTANVAFFENEKAVTTGIKDVKIEKDDSVNLLESYAAFPSLYDYSGFDELSQAQLVEENDKYILKVKQRGYAVSNFIPVTPGDYKLLPAKHSHYTMFMYGKDKNLMKIISFGAVIQIPEDVAYIRFFIGGNGFTEGLALTSVKKATMEENKPLEASAEKNKSHIFSFLAQAKKTLVSESKATAEIIINGSAADLREHFAANELLYWTGKVSDGAKLPLLATPSKHKNIKIHIGRFFAETIFPDDLKKMEKTEGFAIRSKGNNIYIFGASSKGTLFGTWRFIEDNLDLIWSRPHTEYGAVYEIKKDIPIIKSDYIDIPVFPLRSWSMPGGVSDMEITNLFYARNGGNPFISTNHFGWSHYLGKLYARSMRVGGGFMYGFLGKYKDTNPEFFPLSDGRRKLSNHAQPCFTNPGAIETLIKEARIHLQNAPDENIYLDCGNEDTWLCCECETCLAPIKLPDGTKMSPKSKFSEKDPLFRSTQLYMFLNKLAEALEKDYPDTKIITLAYIFSAEYPKVPVHKNVLVLYAPYPTHNMRIPLRNSHSKGTAEGSTWAERFKQWGESGSTLAFYEYLGNATFNAMADVAQENLIDLKNYGGWGINSEALQEFDKNLYGIGNFKQLWDVNSMNMWTITKMMWNPELNLDELRREFIRKTYREAAPQMTEFFDIIIRNWNDPKLKHMENCHTGRSNVFKRYIVETGNEKRARELLLDAEKAAMNPYSKLLIADILKSFDEWANSLGRIRAPYVEEATHEAFDFSSPHWEKAQLIDNEFYMPRQYLTTLETRLKPDDLTKVQIMRDKEYLYLKITATLPDMKDVLLTPKSDKETFPFGEHIEIQFRHKGVIYLFATDLNENKYDLKNWDRSWNSSWKVKARKNANSWEVVTAIPMRDINYDLENKAETPLEFMFSRVRAKHNGEQVESTYKGFAPNGEHIWSPLTIHE